MSKKRTSRKSKNPAKKPTQKSTEKPAAQQKEAKKPQPQPAKKKTGGTRGKQPVSFIGNLNRRSALKILAGVGIAGVGVSTLHAYDSNQKTLHDLTVIGQGAPVVVQIHNPSCPTCRRLKSAVTTAMKATPEIHFRLADITTAEGKAIQDQHDVPHVTLLFFDASGKHVHTTRGLLTPDQVRNNIARYLS